MPFVSMTNVESSPEPTVRSKHEPSATGVIDPPSLTTVHVPVTGDRRLDPTFSSSSSFAAVTSFAATGMKTTFIAGSAYAPSTFCINQVVEVPEMGKIPAHSNALSSSASQTSWINRSFLKFSPHALSSVQVSLQPSAKRSLTTCTTPASSGHVISGQTVWSGSLRRPISHCFAQTSSRS